MKNSVEIIVTADGSHSLLNTALNETYHSQQGAVQESKHVFIENGLQYFVDAAGSVTVRILEIGFGTGLNALLSFQFALNHHDIQIEYDSIETFPLGESIWSQLNYSPSHPEHLQSLHTAEWNKPVAVLRNFKLHKIREDLQSITLTTKYDVIFFDAFAPNKQPEMWELPMLQKVANCLKSGGVFVTYCAKGQVKRDLRTAGLEVQTLPGPPGKKEMVRALKI